MKLPRVIVTLLLVLMLSAVTVYSQDAPVTTRSEAPSPRDYQLEEVVGGFTYPIYLTHAGDGSGRLFVAEQSGRIWIIKDGQIQDMPFLDLSGLVTQDVLDGYSEAGLLGLAFHPDYAENGWFYVDYTTPGVAESVIARYSVSVDNPDLADPNSAQVLLTQDQPYWNHNGGQLAFGLDGYLYISFGDGGSAGDPQRNAQNLNTLLGKILRIDVNGDSPYVVPPDNPFVNNPDVRPEIWAYGLRNPWRFSFDSATGDLYIADVGQNQWEEVNFQPADSPGGENYGWNVYEGNHTYSGGAAPENMTPPILEYSHNEGISVTGGYVYRGETMPDLQGVYLYADWDSGMIWAGYRDTAGSWHSSQLIPSPYSISSFGEDEAGELYVVTYYEGTIFRLAPRPAA